ncbi:MAG: undecaprenyldiphospho-muramoylpentapeptide beta-N-acetylglucosaminyltransferase [Bacteroidaceae bacterium]|nr:undecaprenyldiphospho-muramoylpentapeptide beta-N-acetylglucosaminyltransferase [Bacteroidaceae bacterium]MBQ8937793.1 undecaprenyldiphospho-muramoylpentapeptide beta-N-acetylglucosaminyltransferase [Bacteroidaceae bacterium]MBR0243487.1 undecaprenyldiphospho-muramoylpentapeptide beta-N-acetylglucosaminyltransferase [Bacteroidaceae bacterium]MBR1666358.1 undecaprenyldiphospho-muramoylpentapeptide beta-N-acetylglucosaminyltransferase [Bacteroidaceae bacterium]
MATSLKVIISGGGTGGHIFPALSIANAIRALRPEAEILFVGAEGRMEMKRVPDAGYRIVGLPIRGFLRPLWNLGNIGVALDYLKSKRMAKKLLREFQPQVAVGVGGYASSAALGAANSLGIPTLLQEQNSFAGLANKQLAKNAAKICVAYEGMERFFPKDKIMLTGNPVRQSLLECKLTKPEAVERLGFDPVRPLILIIGGSLGARTINESVLQNLQLISESRVQIVWQTGGYYFEDIKQSLAAKGCPANLKVTDFITRMDEAYRAADLVISRAGASSISELCLLGKASILVPSPNVAEDHQTHNAMALVHKDAALLVKDIEAREQLLPLAVRTALDIPTLQRLSANAKAMGLPDSARIIAEEVIKLSEK